MDKRMGGGGAEGKTSAGRGRGGGRPALCCFSGRRDISISKQQSVAVIRKARPLAAALIALAFSASACSEPPRASRPAAAGAQLQRNAWEAAPTPREMDRHQSIYAAPYSPKYPIFRAPNPLPPGHFRRASGRRRSRATRAREAVRTVGRGS